ncbi:Hypothetical protein (Fragment) [Durusdinium trenchii]|uniref:Uncharacterized protein n=1 Tax=Durusdinium trenchii TaxID=1381693 RepID=A0ABP0NM95_9DINO
MVKQKKSPERNEDEELQVGDTVEIFGLQGAKDLNGQIGRIISFVEETQRPDSRRDEDRRDDHRAIRAYMTGSMGCSDEMPKYTLRMAKC